MALIRSIRLEDETSRIGMKERRRDVFEMFERPMMVWYSIALGWVDGRKAVEKGPALS